MTVNFSINFYAYTIDLFGYAFLPLICLNMLSAWQATGQLLPIKQGSDLQSKMVSDAAVKDKRNFERQCNSVKYVFYQRLPFFVLLSFFILHLLPASP